MAGRIVVLVPAHNEERSLPAALASLREQGRPADRIIVVADNCTDGTAAVARAAGVEVFETVRNRDKKAGGLNQALAVLLDLLDPADLVLVMDADGTLSPTFLETAAAELADPSVGAVGGVFWGEAGAGLIGALQRNEYARYAREIDRRRGRAHVLTGTATLHRVDVLRQIAATRGRTLPGPAGKVYDTTALTEDNEITLAIKTLGYRCVSPAECRVETEVMPTWGDLWRQRIRWQRGALENLKTYGLTRVTAPYALQQVGMGIGVVAMWLFLLLTALTIHHGFEFRPLWFAVGLIFVVERVVTVSRRGPRAMALALTMVVEWAYDLFLQVVLIRSAWDVLRRTEARWHHVVVATDN
ncbi:cellulose synthase/poly-beta-1,6-N-acetylglucosamine synthase-like glycosyltransferase [Kribbella amoyensis]|uniref:Cellulose synthase/poly-beta-1,6-N-acetylglucosamine synthase-like glycosyltransferase n=1 Tax=Kribbella amoyensis TaxID=996641 RepID=A0A561BYY5_9ACTN|nr:glycosyltransferase family 2 protein [Kribbella amoyensis]TWD84061.1 cellulose synthase/poly-beta-1,6-N-acetylglucosamine synthase-like glycosyltransferase [Kribbella amoyensis]